MQTGEYVRTKKGLIDKINKYSFGCNIWHCENGMCIDECNCIGTHLKDVIKHSKNIIDLIKIGDIVFTEDFNGYDFIHIYCKEILEALKEDVKIKVKINSILTK